MIKMNGLIVVALVLAVAACDSKAMPSAPETVEGPQFKTTAMKPEVCTLTLSIQRQAPIINVRMADLIGAERFETIAGEVQIWGVNGWEYYDTTGARNGLFGGKPPVEVHAIWLRKFRFRAASSFCEADWTVLEVDDMNPTGPPVVDPPAEECKIYSRATGKCEN